MRLTLTTPSRRRAEQRRRAMRTGLIVGGTTAAAAMAIVRGRGRLRYSRGVVRGMAHRATGPLRRGGREYDDVTLARKVESELFRPADAPKGKVDVNVQHGVVELRGQVDRDEEIEALGEAAARVEGVKGVHNLLHTPGSPPKHAPPSDPDEVRARAEQPRARSRFSRNPATTPGDQIT